MKEKNTCTWRLYAWFSLAMEAQVQAQKLLFHSEKGLDAGISTSRSIKFGVFLVLAVMLVACCVYTATSEKEILLRHNTSTSLYTPRGHVWPMKTLDPDYLAPKQFSQQRKARMVFLVLLYASEFLFDFIHPYCLRFCFRLCLRY